MNVCQPQFMKKWVFPNTVNLSSDTCESLLVQKMIWNGQTFLYLCHLAWSQRKAECENIAFRQGRWVSGDTRYFKTIWVQKKLFVLDICKLMA